MAILTPVNITHNNPELPTVYFSDVKGNVWTTGSHDEQYGIPEGKRELGMIVYFSSSQDFKYYKGGTTSSGDWATPANWGTLGGGTFGSSNFIAPFNNQSTWTINHNLDYKYVLVQIFDSSDNQIIPEEITLIDNNTAQATFNSNVTGTAVVTVGGTTLNTTLPTGSNTQIQYNNGGVFGASSKLTFDGNIYTLKASSGTRTSFSNPSQYYNYSQVLQINELNTTWISGSTTGYQFGDKFDITGTWSVGSPISAFDIVFLSGSNNTWYRVVQSDPSLASRLLGIYIPGEQIMTECYTTVTSSSVATPNGPQVDGTLEPGAPVYLKENATTSPWLSTTRPTNSGGVVRIVGHLMYQRSTDANYWLMHFRPDHTWVEIALVP